TREWVQMQQAVMEEIRLGRSVLSPYGMSHEVEFFAVAVETFFQTPIAMRKRHDDLYSFLSRYFEQDPAAWEDRRAIEREPGCERVNIGVARQESCTGAEEIRSERR